MKSGANNQNHVTNSTEELIASIAEQALQYVDRYYGRNHAIAQSVHSQIDMFCNDAEHLDRDESNDSDLAGSFGNSH